MTEFDTQTPTETGFDVAYVVADPGVPVFGTKGASVHVQELVRTWRARGARVRIYCTREGDHRPADLADVEVTCVKVAKGDTASREVAQAHAAQELARAVLADGADVVHERYSLFSTALATITAKSAALGVLEVNAPLIEEQATHRELVDREAAEAALVTQVRAAACTYAVSRSVAGWVEDRVPGSDPLVVPNGVNPDRLRPVHTPADAPAVVVFVGTLKPWHGVEVMLEAAALARQDWTVRLVGDGPQGESLRQLAAERGLDVEFVGAVDPAQIPESLDGALVAVAPYPDGQDQYFSPLKVLEYSSAALPVVASEVGQLGELVDHGVTGILVPPSDAPALAAAIDTLVGTPARAREMGERGRAKILAGHTWSHGLDEIVTRLHAGQHAPLVGATA